MPDETQVSASVVHEITRDNRPDFTREDWVVALIVFWLVLIVWVRRNFPEVIKKAWEGIWINKMARSTYVEREERDILGNLLMNIMGTMVVSYFIREFIINELKDVDAVTWLNQGLGLFLMTWGGLVMFVWGKTTLVKLIAQLFEDKLYGHVYVRHIWLFYKLMVLVLFPFVLVGKYMLFGKQYWLIVAYFVFAISYFIRIFRTFIFAVNRTEFPAYASILYICILEIVPLVLFGNIYLRNL